MEQETMALQGMQEQTMGFVDKVKAWFANLEIAQKLELHKYSLLEMGAYFVAGLVFGVVIKKYLKYILLLVLFVVAAILLEQFDMVSFSVNWAKIQELFSIKTAAPIMDATLVEQYWQWVKANAWIVLSATLGFVAGLKLG